MSKQEDILQIKKYLDGELDARAMHELEHRALDDPFLADALEGYEHAKTDQQDNLAVLADRLQQRTDQQAKRIIPWRAISIAASVIIVLGIGVWIFTGGQSEKQQLVAVRTDTVQKAQPAQVVAAEKAVADTTKLPGLTQAVVAKRTIPQTLLKKSTLTKYADVHAAADKNVQADASVTEVPMAANAAPVMKQDTVMAVYKAPQAANEVAVKEMSDKKKDGLVANKPVPSASPETLLQGKVPGLSVTPSGKTLSGTVLGADNSQPIIGAIVKLEGAKFGSVTDANGRFMLSGVPDKPIISVGYVGYNTRQVKAENSDSLNIALEPNNSSLSEVVVTGYATKKKANRPADEAHPLDGWQALDDYIKKTAVLPGGETGSVQLSFRVNGDGRLTDFKIIKSMSPAADQKAIGLITNGPQWIGNSDKTPHEVKVTIKFH